MVLAVAGAMTSLLSTYEYIFNGHTLLEWDIFNATGKRICIIGTAAAVLDGGQKIL